MNKQPRYHINPEIKYGHLELIDVPEIVKQCTHPWFNQTLTRVNNSLVRLGILEGEFHWHKHDRNDEFFFVLSGRLLIDLDERTIELGPQQGMTVPKGARHRPRAPEKTVVLMVESEAIDPRGSQSKTSSPT